MSISQLVLSNSHRTLSPIPAWRLHCDEKTIPERRRQLMVLDAKRAVLRADALTETNVKPSHLRDTETMLAPEVVHVRHQQLVGNSLCIKLVQHGTGSA